MLVLRTLQMWVVADDEAGATAVEYGLMLALIALAIVAAVTALGLVLPGLFTPVSDTLA